MKVRLSLIFILFFSIQIIGYTQVIVKTEKDSIKEIIKESVSDTSTDLTQEIEFTYNGVSYSFKSDKIIDFKKANIVFPEGTIASLIETRDNKTIEAELRIKNDDYQLLLIKEGNLNDYYNSDEEWLNHFLKMIVRSQEETTEGNNLSKEDGKTVQIKKIIKTDSLIISDETNSQTGNGSSIDVFLNTLKNLNLETNRFELLSKKIENGILLKDQKKLIGFIFGNFNNEENKVQLLNQLIESPFYSKENNDYLMSFIDQLHMESNKVMLLKKLIK